MNSALSDRSLPRAIVTYARNRIAYVSMRSLAKRGVKVTAADSVPLAMSYFSHYCSARFKYPAPFTEPRRFIQSIVKYTEGNSPCVLLPTHNEIFVLARHMDELEARVEIPIAPYESLVRVHLKDRLLDLAERSRVVTPATCLPESLREVHRLTADLKYPVMIKPRSGYGNHGVEYVSSRSELLPKFLKTIRSLRLLPNNYPIIQEFIPGKKVAVIMLMNRGRPRAKYSYTHLRTLQQVGGTATLRTGIVDPKAERSLERLLKHVHWHGLAQAEFVIEESTQEPFIIDVNPRFSGSIYQAICGGVDFPLLLYRMAVNGDIEPIKEGEIRCKTRWLWGDYCRLLREFMHGPSKLETLQEFFQFAEPDTFYDDLDRSDPMPFLVSPLPNLIQFLKTRTLDPPSPFLQYALD